MTQAWESYRRPRLVFDPWQAISLAQRLRKQGAQVTEFAFGAHAWKIAAALSSVLRERRLDAPNDERLRSELQTVRIIETGPNRLKIDNPAGTHDDLATAIGLAAVTLLERGEEGRATSINILDIRRAGRNPTIEHSTGMALRGAKYLDRGPDGQLVPPPAWRRRER